ncbi:PCI domain-containing protein [Ditylenchus destructor]|nr:PCI domain-containing protein [Ditylenchus destructor]
MEKETKVETGKPCSNKWDDKIKLLCEVALSCQSKDRKLSFEEISQKTQLETVSQVEILVMKAINRGVVRGSINQVRGVVTISWIQPKDLSLQQVAGIADRVDVWRRDVETMESLVTKNASEMPTNKN